MGSTESSTDQTLVNTSTPNLFSLHDRTIIVTGATGGLGSQLTRAILESGGDVIAIDYGEVTPTTWEPLQSLAKSLSRNLTYHACDISSQSLTTSVFEVAAAQARYPVRGLINCAGIGTAAAKVVTKQYHEGKSLGASFVFVASMSGYISNKATPTAIYSASKAGVHQLVRSLAGEWGSSSPSSPSSPIIRVNSISPGVIETPMTQHVLAKEEWTSVWRQEAMLKRISTPDEYRGAVIFLLADASSYVTGTDLRVDGGSTAW
ncbi:enoyl-(Acyl carrier protein) reductase domain-containing protein [Trichoderma breve]|uniref:Enoyl-(Acyl carrier protein) reductase domain-containing protein n=1 Tax=Trichoderma breve TaxID=2034170 RepID=A0A9W9BAF2_9HYPO|nr:enoyl-(Acyl carrier protein) reductase domain-containing protein [Trichoderma breve]KAJ4859628.1 enoyl-(Acyl carrier protein) reductase domain-containing protein [Trichoderma breve]